MSETPEQRRALNDIITEYAAPALADCWFTRSGRTFYLVEPDEVMRFIVQFRPKPSGQDVGFTIEWGACPLSMCAMLGGRSDAKPRLDWSLIFTDIIAPETLRRNEAEVDRWYSKWSAGPQRIGTGLRDVLTTEMVPYWRSLFDRSVVLELLRTHAFEPSNYTAHANPLLASLALYIDDGDVGWLHTVLEQAQRWKPDDERVAWFAERLAARGT